MGIYSVIIYVFIAMLILLFLSQNNPKPPPHPFRRLKLRSNFTIPPPNKTNDHHHIAFDPVVAEIQRKIQDKQFVQTHHHQNVTDDVAEEFKDAEEFLNDERKFNVTQRLVVLFPDIDVDPTDGFVSEAELTQWNLIQSMTELMYRTQREMAIHDKNKDGFVSFAEYDPMKAKQPDNHSYEFESGWYQEDHFNASDVNGDGLLNITEFKDFLHTGDTKNPKLLMWLCQEEIREIDANKDGKVDFQDFFKGVYDLLISYDVEDHHTMYQNNSMAEFHAKTLFTQLDKDRDGYLSDVELLPIIGKLHPSEHFFAKQQAYYAIRQADLDKDGRLTLKEMVENPYAFYTSIYNADDDDDYDGDDYGIHDEFR